MSGHHFYNSSSPTDDPNFINRTLPPIREVFANELSIPVRAGEGQRSHRSQPPSGRPYTSSANYPGYMANNSRGAPTTDSTVPQQRSDSRTGHSSRLAFSSPTYNTGNNADHGRSITEGYSYGVLRNSGTSGVLTNAIPPSGKPQGILRQTSTPMPDEPESISKRYKCEYCGKRFSMPSHFQIHLRTHTAQRPFPCEIPGCDKTFSVKSNLNRHMRTHEKPDSARNEY